MSPREADGVLAAVRRIPMELVSQGNLTVLDEVLSPDFVDHSFAPGMPQDKDGLQYVVGRLRTAMPDVQMTIDIELRDRDFVVHHVHGHGTNTGPAFGRAPTGRRIVWAETHIYRTRGPFVVEHWGVVKLDTIWRELGMTEIPARNLSDVPLAAATGTP